MEVLNKVVRVGKGPDGNVFCNIKFADGKLSITGVIGPKSDGNCKGSCGQIDMSEWDITKYAPGWTRELEQQFRTVWGEWHLNDLQAGSPAQTAYLKANPEKSYDKACEALTAAGLNPDPGYLHNGKPYKYGNAWLGVGVPADVLDFLAALPETDIQPAWV